MCGSLLWTCWFGWWRCVLFKIIFILTIQPLFRTLAVPAALSLQRDVKSYLTVWTRAYAISDDDSRETLFAMPPRVTVPLLYITRDPSRASALFERVLCGPSVVGTVRLRVRVIEGKDHGVDNTTVTRWAADGGVLCVAPALLAKLWPQSLACLKPSVVVVDDLGVKIGKRPGRILSEVLVNHGASLVVCAETREGVEDIAKTLTAAAFTRVDNCGAWESRRRALDPRCDWRTRWSVRGEAVEELWLSVAASGHESQQEALVHKTADVVGGLGVMVPNSGKDAASVLILVVGGGLMGDVAEALCGHGLVVLDGRTPPRESEKITTLGAGRTKAQGDGQGLPKIVLASCHPRVLKPGTSFGPWVSTVVTLGSDLNPAMVEAALYRVFPEVSSPSSIHNPGQPIRDQPMIIHVVSDRL